MQTRLSFAALLLIAATAFAADHSPSLAEAESAMKSALIKARGEASVKGFSVRGLHGCFPLKGRPAGDVLCLVEMPGNDGELRTQEIPFRHSGGSWALINPDEEGLNPACPDAEEAQRAFRVIKKLDSLKVIDVDEEGQLVDERGRFEKVKAPWRLMCVYTVETKPAGEQTYVAYISREGGKYVFDPEIEVWLD